MEPRNIAVHLNNTSTGQYDLSSDFTASDASTPSPLRTGRYVDGGNSLSLSFPLPNWGYLTTQNGTVTGQPGSSIGVGFQGFVGFLSSTDTEAGLAGSELLTCSPLNRQTLLNR